MFSKKEIMKRYHKKEKGIISILKYINENNPSGISYSFKNDKEMYLVIFKLEKNKNCLFLMREYHFHMHKTKEINSLVVKYLMDVLKFKLNDNEYKLQNIFILGNTCAGKTTIARRIIKQLKPSGIEIIAMGDKAYVDYDDLDINIFEPDDNNWDRKFIKSLKEDLEERIKTDSKDNIKLIIIDDISGVIAYPFADDESITNLSYLIEKGKDYGIYFIILSQRICEATYKDEYRKNIDMHIYMRCNNEEESRFLIGNDSLKSLNRGEYILELKHLN